MADSDVVFHLAAAVGVKLILAEPIESFRTNVLGTEAVLCAAERYGTKVLIASTSEVYGKVARLPQREDDDVLLGPTSISRWSYAACKMLDEFIGLAYAKRGLPVVCFRLFNTVGPRQSGFYGMVIPRFVDAALRDEPLQVHGDGSQSRCFLHVRDAVSAIMRLERTPRAVGEVFNIGSTESVTILELAERVIDKVGTGNGLAATLAGSLNGNGNRPRGGSSSCRTTRRIRTATSRTSGHGSPRSTSCTRRRAGAPATTSTTSCGTSSQRSRMRSHPASKRRSSPLWPDAAEPGRSRAPRPGRHRAERGATMARVNVGPTRRVASRRQALAVAALAAAIAGALVVGQRAGAWPSAGSEVWKPGLRTTWQWQITGRVDESVKAAMYDIDVFDARPGQVNAGVIGRLQARKSSSSATSTRVRGRATGPTRPGSLAP